MNGLVPVLTKLKRRKATVPFCTPSIRNPFASGKLTSPALYWITGRVAASRAASMVTGLVTRALFTVNVPLHTSIFPADATVAMASGKFVKVTSCPTVPLGQTPTAPRVSTAMNGLKDPVKPPRPE